MSYRLPTPLPEVREPDIAMFDVARNSYITVNNGTVSRINIPCVYGRGLTRWDKMLFDHMTWPSPDWPDKSNYDQIFVIHDIDLEDEGYTSVIVALSDDAPNGLTITGELDYNHIELKIIAICDSVVSDDVETEFFVYITGENEEIGQLRDLVTKGIIRIVAGIV